MTIGTLYPDNTSVLPTVTDSLFQQKKIQRNLIALSLEPATASGVSANGEISFGVIDATKYTGLINFL
jgi:cathepsin E